MRTRLRVTCLLLGLGLCAPASAGVNAGFAVAFGGPERIDNPAVGQRLSIPVFYRNLTEMKGGAASLRYDPAFVTFSGFTAGTVTPGAFGLPGQPQVGEDGLATIEGGTTLLGAGVTQVTSGGLFGTFAFELIAELPEGGSAISLFRAEVNTSSEDDDRDVIDGEAAAAVQVRLVPVFPNAVFNVTVERKQNGASLAWSTRLIGLEDIVRIRVARSDAEFRVLSNPAADRFGTQVQEAYRTLRQRGVNFPAMRDAEVVAALRDLLELPNATDDEVLRLVRRVREFDNILQSRSHVVPIPNLAAQTEYEFQIVSRSFDGRRSPTHTGRFSTRLAPDLRPLFVSQFDTQVSRTGAAVNFGTNRPASTTYILRQLPANEIVVQDTLNEDGETRTRISLEDLSPATEYEIEVTTTLIGATDLIDSGLPADAAGRTLRKRFRTRANTRRLVMLKPPFKIVGSDRANIVFEANQPVNAIVDYGLVPVGSGKIAQGDDVDSESLYTWQQESVSSLNLHNLTLSNLDPATLVRYKITLINADGDTFTTDPTGNFQHSRDLMFRTAAAGDTLPPEVILGPLVAIRDVLAIVRFATDVPTAASIFVGTDGGTYNTEDEFEFQDLTPDGERRFSNRHSIIVSGLDAGSSYRYRLEVESTSGKTAVLEPSLNAGKRAGLRQPPGGAGSFTTSNDPDTQFPVILSGPTISSKSHETAIIEWTTDEPANSEVEFGLTAVGDDSESSAVTTTSHKVTLSNLTAGQTYSYKVASTDASGNGATQSSEAVFTTDSDVDLTAPSITSAPQIVYKNNESATVQWTTDEDASGEVTFGTESDNLGFVRTLPTTDQTHEVTLTNLEASTTYFYQVSSSDLSNNGPTTSTVTSFTTDAAADVTLPVISNVAVSESDSSAIFTWQTDELADGFVDFGTVSGILDLTVGDANDVTQHEITVTNLTPGQTYFYTVGSIDRANNGPTESVEGSFVTLSSADLTPPATPSSLSGTAGSQQVLLTWSANTETDLAGYNIYRRTAGSETFTAIASRVTATSYTDAGRTNDVTYEYQITAIDRSTPPNESVASSQLALTPTLSAAPTTAADLVVGGEALVPTFTFTNAEPFNSGATLTYTIQISTQSDFSDVTASASGVAQGQGTTSWTSTRTLIDGQTYYWRVRAVEGSLTGPFTTAQEFTASTASLLAGDFNDSGAVDFDDFFAFVDAFGQSADDFPGFDLNGSGSGTTIDFDDFFAFVDAFGTSAGKAAGAWALAHRLDETARIRLVADGGPMAPASTSDLRRDEVRLRVFGDDIANVRAYGLVLSYDPAVLSFNSAVEGPGSLLGSQGSASRLFQVLDERPGRLLIGNGLAQGQAVSGSGMLAELTFQIRDRRLASDTRFDLQQAFIAGDADNVRRAVGVEAVRLQPSAFALGQAYPNPFNPSTHIDFALAQETTARLVVYDILGRTVRTLVRAHEALPAGFYSVSWDGRDASGRAVGNGLYFYRLETPTYTRSGKMMMLK